MLNRRLFELALSYRIIYAMLGGFVTARLAPWTSMRHVRVLGILGLVAGSAGVLVSLSRPEFGPGWYPIMIALTAYPATWIGGKLGSLGR
jgi:hypothetical protein